MDSGKDIVRSLWRHREPGRNDLATFRAHHRPRTDIRNVVTTMPKVAKFLVG